MSENPLHHYEQSSEGLDDADYQPQEDEEEGTFYNNDIPAEAQPIPQRNVAEELSALHSAISTLTETVAVNQKRPNGDTTDKEPQAKRHKKCVDKELLRRMEQRILQLERSTQQLTNTIQNWNHAERHQQPPRRDASAEQRRDPSPQDERRMQKSNNCTFCSGDHWPSACTQYRTLSERRQQCQVRNRCERCLRVANHLTIGHRHVHNTEPYRKDVNNAKSETVANVALRVANHLVTSCHIELQCFYCRRDRRAHLMKRHNSAFCPYQFPIITKQHLGIQINILKSLLQEANEYCAPWLFPVDYVPLIVFITSKTLIVKDLKNKITQQKDLIWSAYTEAYTALAAEELSTEFDILWNEIQGGTLLITAATVTRNLEKRLLELKCQKAIHRQYKRARSFTGNPTTMHYTPYTNFHHEQILQQPHTFQPSTSYVAKPLSTNIPPVTTLTEWTLQASVNTLHTTTQDHN
ncbi:hypothetical protein COOONC_13373 [Cooperia oncophora]